MAVRAVPARRAMTKFSLALLLATFALVAPARAGSIEDELVQLQRDWEVVRYQTPAAGRDTLRAVNRLCPQAPVLTLNRATPENPPGPSQPSSPIPPVLHGLLVEDVLRTQLGIPCMRVQ